MRKLLSLMPAMALVVCLITQTGWVLGWAVVATVCAVGFAIDYMVHQHEPGVVAVHQAAMEVLFDQRKEYPPQYSANR